MVPHGMTDGVAIRPCSRFRPYLLVVLAALPLVACLCLARTAAGAEEPYPAKPRMAAQSARAFGDSVGVNVHLASLPTSYGDFTTLEARLRELGVRYVRDGICPTCTYQISRLKRLAAAGIRSNIIAGQLSDSTATLAGNLRAIRDLLPESVVSVEAPNEPDITGDPEWVQHTRVFQQELYSRVKSDPRLAHLSVLGPALVNPSSPSALGNLAPYLDRGNSHPYPGGGTPLHNLAEVTLLAAAVSGTKPIVATEAGYHSDLTTTGGHYPASERAIGIYMPRLALEGFRVGFERTYVYELANPWPDSSRPPNVSLAENSLGLLRGDLSRKPSFLALRNLLRTVTAGSAPVTTPGGLRLGLEGAGPDVRQQLLQSADGSYALVLWREVSVWDRVARRDLFPEPKRLEVVLGEPVALAQRFEPVESDAELQRWTNPRRMAVDLSLIHI